MDIAFTVFLLGIIIVAAAIGAAMYSTEKGLPISWQKYIEANRRAFLKHEQDYEIEITVSNDRRRRDSYYPFDFVGFIVRKGETPDPWANKYQGSAKTPELAFRNALKKGHEWIKQDMKSRKPTVNKTYKF